MPHSPGAIDEHHEPIGSRSSTAVRLDAGHAPVEARRRDSLSATASGSVVTRQGDTVPGDSETTSLSTRKPYLVAMTTCNQWYLTDAAISNLQSLQDPIDLIIIDDYSEDGTADKARARGVHVIEVQLACIERSMACSLARLLARLRVLTQVQSGLSR
jgi:hypothetical protein